MRGVSVAVVLAVLGLSGCGGSNDPNIVVVTRDTSSRPYPCKSNASAKFDARKILGLSIERARRTAEARGCSVRVIAGDTISDSDGYTLDGVPSRIDVETQKGVVTEILPEL